MEKSVPWLAILSLFLPSLSPLIPLVSAVQLVVDPSLLRLLRDSGDLPIAHPDLNVVVSRELVGAGFHRTLLTRVEQVYYKTSHVTTDTALSVVLVENVSCDMYVDMDMQISSIGDYAGPELIASSYMDTEKPASLSSHHIVMAFTDIGGKVEFPLHFRYQLPSPSNSPYKTVTVPPPAAFIRTDQLPRQLQQNNHTITLPCNTSYTPPHKDHTPCRWMRAQLRGTDLKRENFELSVDIPQGLEDHRTVVVVVTVLTTLVATVYIACNFLKVKDRTASSKKNQ